MKIRNSLRLLFSEMKNGGAWFAASSAFAPAASILVGPLILGKAGLEAYAVLSLAAYFTMLAGVYADFGAYPHFIAAFAKRSSNRFTDLGSALVFRVLILSLFYAILAALTFIRPRGDDLYAYLGISLTAFLLPSIVFEWYFISKMRHFELFCLRLTSSLFLVISATIWYISPSRNILLVPAFNVIAALASSLWLIVRIERQRIIAATRLWQLVSMRTLYEYLVRIFPLAATQLVTPYFLAYAIAWYSMVSQDNTTTGAFSLSYRLALAFAGLCAPAVFYLMPRLGEQAKRLPARQIVSWATVITLAGWVASLPMLWYYFLASGIDSSLLSFSVKILAILFIGVFFGCVRIPYVSQVITHGHYKAYFLIHFLACAPVLLLSWLTRDSMPAEAVPWLACLPDALATLGFIAYHRRISSHVVDPSPSR